MKILLDPTPVSEEVVLKYLPQILTILILSLFLTYAFYVVMKGFYKTYIATKNQSDDFVYGLSTSNTRSNKWKSISFNYKKKNGKCAVCGKTTNLVVHHKVPFHMSPEKELDENNFVVLCENRPVNCHYLFGHLMNWQGYNQNIDEDIEIWKKKLETN